MMRTWWMRCSPSTCLTLSPQPAMRANADATPQQRHHSDATSIGFEFALVEIKLTNWAELAIHRTCRCLVFFRRTWTIPLTTVVYWSSWVVYDLHSNPLIHSFTHSLTHSAEDNVFSRKIITLLVTPVFSVEIFQYCLQNIQTCSALLCDSVD